MKCGEGNSTHESTKPQTMPPKCTNCGKMQRIHIKSEKLQHPKKGDRRQEKKEALDPKRRSQKRRNSSSSEEELNASLRTILSQLTETSQITE